jgi:hypothetical protein
MGAGTGTGCVWAGCVVVVAGAFESLSVSQPLRINSTAARQGMMIIFMKQHNSFQQKFQ